MDIKVNYHSSICLNDKIYIDPLNIKDAGRAEIIFITHPHYDHFSPEDIKKIANKSTIFVCPLSMKAEFEKEFRNKVVYVEPDNQYEVSGIKFRTIPAYNINKQYHPKSNMWVGYIIELEGKDIAITGDTDATSELLKLKNIDVLMLPIGGTFTMTAVEAAHLVNEIKPKLVIPIHYGSIVGTVAMADEFVKNLDKTIKCDIKLH